MDRRRVFTHWRISFTHWRVLFAQWMVLFGYWRVLFAHWRNAVCTLNGDFRTLISLSCILVEYGLLLIINHSCWCQVKVIVILFTVWAWWPCACEAWYLARRSTETPGRTWRVEWQNETGNHTSVSVSVSVLVAFNVWWMHTVFFLWGWLWHSCNTLDCRSTG